MPFLDIEPFVFYFPAPSPVFCQCGHILTVYGKVCQEQEPCFYFFRFPLPFPLLYFYIPFLEYTEYYYYILEAKIVLHPDIIVSIMTEFVENTNGEEAEKQDCERNACYRLMGRLKLSVPLL